VALVTWTQQALDDLEAVCLFIARDAPQYAQLFAALVFRATDRLEDFPQMGRIVPEIARDDIRESLFKATVSSIGFFQRKWRYLPCTMGQAPLKASSRRASRRRDGERSGQPLSSLWCTFTP
jgi:plasmid stabilization system protein ParE